MSILDLGTKQNKHATLPNVAPVANPGVAPHGYPANQNGQEPLDKYLRPMEPQTRYGGLSGLNRAAIPQKTYPYPTQGSYGPAQNSQTFIGDDWDHLHYPSVKVSGYGGTLGPLPERFDEWAWLKWRQSVVGSAGLTPTEASYIISDLERPIPNDLANIAIGLGVVVLTAVAGVGVGTAVNAGGTAAAGGVGIGSVETGSVGTAASAGTVAGSGTIVAGTAVPATAGGGGILASIGGTVTAGAVAIGKKEILQLISPPPKNPAGITPIPGPPATQVPTVAVIGDGTPSVSIAVDSKSLIVYGLLGLLALFIVAGKNE